jgi:hypothetical protein
MQETLHQVHHQQHSEGDIRENEEPDSQSDHLSDLIKSHYHILAFPEEASDDLVEKDFGQLRVGQGEGP